MTISGLKGEQQPNVSRKQVVTHQRTFRTWKETLAVCLQEASVCRWRNTHQCFCVCLEVSPKFNVERLWGGHYGKTAGRIIRNSYSATLKEQNKQVYHEKMNLWFVKHECFSGITRIPLWLHLPTTKTGQIIIRCRHSCKHQHHNHQCKICQEGLMILD